MDRSRRRAAMRRFGSIASGIGTMALVMLLVASCSKGETESNSTSATHGEGSLSPSVLAESDCPHYDCQGPLEPGQYHATYFDPTVAFEIGSPGWTWRYTGNFQMLATDESAEGYADVINFFLDPVIASQDCEDGPEPGVERSVDDLVAWLQAAPGLTTSEGTPVTVGGLDGVRLDLQVAPEWDRTCFYSDGKPVVPLIYSSAFPGGYNWAISPPTSMRWYILDAGNRVLIVDIEDNPKGLSRDALVESGTEIVETFVFSSS
jgi:hypothetical protein